MSCGYVLWMDAYSFKFWRKKRDDSVEGRVYGMEFEQDEKKVSFTKTDEEYQMVKVGLDDKEVMDFLNNVCMVLLEKIEDYFEVVTYDEEWKKAYDGIFEFLAFYLKQNEKYQWLVRSKQNIL